MTSDKTSSKFAQKYISTRTIILVEFFMMKSNSQAYACMQFCKDSHFLTCCVYCVYTSQHVAPDYLFQRMHVEFLNSIFLYSYAFIPIHMFAHVTNRTVACCCNCVVSFFFRLLFLFNFSLFFPLQFAFSDPKRILLLLFYSCRALI